MGWPLIPFLWGAAAGAWLIGNLHEALYERRQVLHTERQQVRKT